MKRQKAILLRGRSHMRIYDILNGRNLPTDSSNGLREKNRQTYGQQREARLDEIRMKINSGYYERRDVLEKVACAIYRRVKK
jgi:hypothetical protein